MANVAPEAVPSADRREEYVLCSGVRSGLKREFVFALKAQAEMLMTPMSRTRSGKIQRSTLQPRDGSAKRRRKSEGADATDAPSKAAEGSPILPPPGESTALGEAEATAISDPEPAMNCAADVDASSVEVQGSAVEDSVSMQTENLAVPVTPPTGQVLAGAGAVADAVPSAPVGARTLMEAPLAIQDESEVGKESAPLIQVGNAPMVETLHEIQVGTEAMADALPSCQKDARPAVKLLQRTQDEAEPLVGTPSFQVDTGPVTESPHTMPVEVESRSDTVMPTEVDVMPVVDKPQKNQIELETMPATVSSVQLDRRPVSVEEKPQISQIEADVSADVTPSIQAEARLATEVYAEIGTHVARNTEEHATIEKPMRRFTRSLLKTAAKEPQLPIVEEAPVLMPQQSPATSGGSDGSKENKDSVDTMNGPHKSPCMTPKKLELKMSKKIALTKFPSNIRGLLATGLLDGLSVKYGTPSFDKREGLRGVIKDGGILCFCASCKGLTTISAYNFELHAGSKKKHPSDFIFLENGNTIHDVLRACSNAPLEMLESAIQNAISMEGSRSLNHDKCKESSSKSHIGKLPSACDSSLVAKLSPESPNLSIESTSTTRPSRTIFSSKTSDCASRSISSPKNIRGRMTQKDLRLHKLVFMDDILPDGTEVAYYARGQRLLQGYIKGSGIFCDCCKTVVSPSLFEAHAGWASRRKPYLNIYTSNGVSLHELSISLSKGKRFSTSESDDLCRICADGGDLLLCDLCPRAFHKECVGLMSIPKGDWYCPCCQNMHLKDKAVEHNENAIAAGRVAGVDPIEEIFKRCIRIVKTPEADVGGCVLCRCHDFSTDFGPRTVLLCDQCEREFHVRCLKEHHMGDLKELPEEKWFCSAACGQIHAALHKLITSGLEQLPIPQSDVMKKKHEQMGLARETGHDVRWRLLSGKTASSETRLLLCAALSIFHECFKPIVDHATKMDYITAMIYGRDIRDQDFGGMYCAVLTVNSSVVSAAILRILGCEVAELPLVATSREYQGKGYFQSLFSCIEGMLASLNVKHLVLPAADEAESIWTKRFGFSKMPVNGLPEYMKGYRTLIFEGTSMLHKVVVPGSATGR